MRAGWLTSKKTLTSACGCGTTKAIFAMIQVYKGSDVMKNKQFRRHGTKTKTLKKEDYNHEEKICTGGDVVLLYSVRCVS
jgi:hypothetical protein